MSEEVKETMDDFARELEASYREFDERRSNSQEQEEGPDAEKWNELTRMMEEKEVVNVKVKEAVKGGLVAYVDEIQGFIPASHVSTHYVEKLEDCVGQRLDVTPITVDFAKKRLVLSARNVLKEREAKEKEAKMAAVKVGAVVKGKVDSIKDYGAFIELDGGLSGLLHVSQISNQRVKSPAAVLKEGQEVTVKIIALKEGKISLSMKALEADGDARDTEVFDYKETGKATTSLGALLKGIKL